MLMSDVNAIPADEVKSLSSSLGLPLLSLTYQESPELDDLVVKWCQHYELVPLSKLEHIREIQCGTLAHMTWTEAPFEVKTLGAMIVAWLFLFDDAYADGALRYQPESLQLVIEATKPFIDPYSFIAGFPKTKWEQSLWDIKCRLLSLYPPSEFLEQFYAAFCEYFEGTIQEVQHRQTGTTVSFENYESFRPSSIGSQVILDYAQLSFGRVLTNEQFADPLLQEARQKAGFLIALTNDFFSFHKEVEEDESFNGALIFCKSLSLSPEEGFLKLQSTHCRLAQELEALLSQLSLHAEGEFSDYCLGIRNWVQGNYEWALRTKRYGRWRDRARDTFASTPDRLH